MNTKTTLPDIINQVEQSACGFARERQHPMVWPDLQLETRFQRAVSLLAKKGVRSYCTLPLTTAQKRFGALGLGSSRPNAYHDDDLHLLRGVAELVALALENAMSQEGKVFIFKIAEAGEVLGLSAEIAGEPFELTAETAGPCQVNFVERDALMRLMEKNGEFGLHVSQALSREFQSAYRDIHDLVLARFSAGKLARPLLSWTPIREQFEAPEIRVRASVTHEEMAQIDWFVARDRDPVAQRTQEKGIHSDWTARPLVIRNRTALEALAA